MSIQSAVLLRNAVSFICILLTMTACQPRKEAREIWPVSIDVLIHWQRLACEVFDEDGQSSIQPFSEQLARWAQTPLRNNPSYLNPHMGANMQPCMISDTTHDHPSALERRKRFMMMRALHIASYWSADLAEGILSNGEYETGGGEFSAQLLGLQQQMPALTKGALSFYDSRPEAGIFAYQRVWGSQRVYVVFNLSFDSQVLPLPHGFMSSTKVSVWRTDDQALRRFVTSSPLQIRGLSGVVVAVGRGEDEH